MNGTSFKSAATAVVLGAAMIVTPTLASAAPRHHGGGGFHRGTHFSGGHRWQGSRHGTRYGHYRGYRGYGGYGYGYDDDAGALAAGAIFGLAAGAIAAGAANSSGSCAQRYRSYDPASGTYLGYDGNRHPCP